MADNPVTGKREIREGLVYGCGATPELDLDVTIDLAAGAIDTDELADDAVSGEKITLEAIGDYQKATEVEVDHADASPVDLLVADATQDRIALIFAEATEAAAGGPEFDVGSETTSTNAAFDDIAAGAWALNDRFVGICMLPAGEKLQCRINVAGTAGKITFHVLTTEANVETSQIADGAVTGVKIADDAVGDYDLPTATLVDHAAGSPVDLLGADANNDRLVLVMVHATETCAGNPEFDIGSETTDTDSLFDDLDAGAFEKGDRFVGACLLPAGEKLQCTINAAGTAGAFNAYVIVVTPMVQTAQIADDAVIGSKLPDDAVNYLYTATEVEVDHADASPVQLLAADADRNRLILVQAIVSETMAGGPDFDAGSETTDPNAVFDDLAAGVGVVDERFVGACWLPHGEKLECTIAAAGTAGKIKFRMVPLTYAVATADIEDAAVTGAKIAAEDAIGYLETAAAVAVDHAGGSPITLLAADAERGRVVLVYGTATEAAESGVCDWDVGAATMNPDNCFDDIGGGTWVVGDRFVGLCDLPRGEALVCTLNTAGAAGAISFRTVVLLGEGGLEGANLEDAAVGYLELATATTIDHGDGAGPHDLLAGDATKARICLVYAEATEAPTGCEWDVGSETTDPDSCFDDIGGGAWLSGDRFVGMCDLPANEKLQVTFNTAGTTGTMLFRVVVVGADLALQTAQIDDGAITGEKIAADDVVGYLELATAVTIDHADGAGPHTLLAASDTRTRIVLVYATCTEAPTGCEWDVGSATTNPDSCFDDIGGGAWEVGDRLVGMCDLPRGEALVVTFNTAGTTGTINFRVVEVLTEGGIAGANLADNAVGYFDTLATAQVEVDSQGAATQDLLASVATHDRICLVQCIITEDFAAAGTPDIDVGSETSDPDAAIDDLNGGTCYTGERYFGACVLPAGEKLQATINVAGAAGKFYARVIALLGADFEIQTAQIAADAVTGAKIVKTAVGELAANVVTAVEVDHGDASPVTLVAADSERTRLILCYAECTETFATAEFDVGSATTDPDAMFDDIGSGACTDGDKYVGICDLPAGEALVCTINVVGTAGKIYFRCVEVLDQGVLLGNNLDEGGVGYLDLPAAAEVEVDHGDASPVQILASDASYDRFIWVYAKGTESAAGGPEFDVGSATTDTDCVFDDLDGGTWLIGDRYVGVGYLPAGEALVCTINVAGTAGKVAFRVGVIEKRPLERNKGTIQLDITTAREIAGDNIQNLAAHGGILASDSVPILSRQNAAVDKALHLDWNVNLVDEVQFGPIAIPQDFDDSTDITIHLMGRMSGANDTPTVDVHFYEGEGDTECGGNTTAFGPTVAEETVTISNGDLSAAPGFWNISLIPGAHANDRLYIFAAWIEYTRKPTSC